MQNVRMKSAVFECWAPDYFRGFGIFLVQGKVRAKCYSGHWICSAFLGNYYQHLGFFTCDLVVLVFVFPIVTPY